MRRLYAVRGATTVDVDTRERIVEATQKLLSELCTRNDIAPDDVVSIIFTTTDDLHAEFPAAGVPGSGLGHVPRICARELDVTSDLSIPRCIRVLMHHYAERSPEPVYLEGAARIPELLERDDG